MSETISSEVPIIAEAEYQADLPDNSGNEYINPEWDDSELFSLVSENQDVIVKCPWMGNAEVTLSIAMTTYTGSWGPENESIIIVEVHQMLANRVTEIEEEPEEEDQPQEEKTASAEVSDKESDTEAEAQKIELKPSTGDTQKQSKQENEKTKPSELSLSRTEKSSVPTNSVVAVQQSTQNTAKTEATANSSNSLANTAGVDIHSASEGLVIADRISENSAPEPAIKSRVEVKQQVPTLEVSDTDTAVNLAGKAEQAPDKSQVVTDQEGGSSSLPVEIKAAAKPEPAELLFSDLENATIADDTSESPDEEMEVIEDHSAIVTFDGQMDVYSGDNFVDNVVLLEHPEENILAPDQEIISFDAPTLAVVEDKLEGGEISTSQLSTEPDLREQTEITGPEALAQISLAVKEIEDSLNQLTERAKSDKPETTEAVNEILEKIVDVPAKVRVYNNENITTTAQAQEELEELFTELLGELDIDFTPELIESLAHQTLKWHVVDEIEKLKNEAKTDKVPQVSTTQKIIKKILVGLSIFIKSIAHAYAIGKSALRLYNIRFAA